MRKMLAASFALVLTPLSVQAEPIQLKYGNAGTPGGTSYVIAVEPFARAVNEDSSGTVEVKLYPGPSLASHTNVIDRLQNDVAQIGFGAIGLYPQLFPKTTVAMLPFESRDGMEATVALWRMYAKGAFGDELAGWKVLALPVYANMSVHTKKPVTVMADLKGQKIANQSRTMAEVLDKLGATPISMPPVEFHQSLMRGVVDGVGTGWPAFPPFKLQEVTAHHVQTSLAAEGVFVFMTKDSYAKLPDQGKAAIDKHAGAAFSAAWGRSVVAMDDAGIAMAKGANQTIVTLAPEEEARWKERAKAVVDAWVAATPDGARVLAAYRAETATFRAAK